MVSKVTANSILKKLESEKDDRCFKKSMLNYITKEIESDLYEISKAIGTSDLEDYARHISYEAIDHAMDDCIGHNVYSKLSEIEMDDLENALGNEYYELGLKYFYQKLHVIMYRNSLNSRTVTPRRKTSPRHKTNGISALKYAYKKML